MSENEFVPGKLDTPEIKAELAKAEALAGDDRILKFVEMQQAKMNDKPTFDRSAAVEPVQLFDQLYFIGNQEVGSFIFKTSEGLLMIDSVFPHMLDTCLLPGMRKMGLDPADVKYLLITHAGPDHIGCAHYFQENYGTTVVMTEEEWRRAPSSEENAARQRARKEPDYVYNPFDLGAAVWPERDVVGKDGDEIVLGELTVQMYSTPRTTRGGGLSYIANVTDNGTEHVWCTYGNTNVVGSVEDMVVYRESVRRFCELAKREHVDSMTSDHPFVDDSMTTIEELRNRKPGEKNPFVLGEDRVAKFFEILDQTAVVIAMRRELGINEAGTGPWEPGVFDLVNGSMMKK